MANRRMFSKKIIDTDAFMDMPLSSQALYFHLAMRADDDGFVANPKKIIRMLGTADDDMKVLLTKKFVLMFENGVCVIKHWLIHNYIQKDRYNQTSYTEELARLTVKDNGGYKMDTECIQNGDTGKVRLELGKVSQDKKSDRFTPPSFSEVSEYIKENNYTVDPDNWYDFYSSKGWMIGKNKMKDWKAAIRTWQKRNASTQSNITVKL